MKASQWIKEIDFEVENENVNEIRKYLYFHYLSIDWESEENKKSYAFYINSRIKAYKKLKKLQNL